MDWAALTPTRRAILMGEVALAVVAVVGIGFVVGRSLSEPEPLAEATSTPEPTATVEAAVQDEADPEPEPEAEPEPEPAPAPEPEITPAPAPAPAATRPFGQLKAIRDESGGSWADLWVDVDSAEFLTGDDARTWLESLGEGWLYNANYWYAKNTSHAITSYRLRSSALPAVWMYTYPSRPAPGFYGPGMSKQVVGFGEFYDSIYMSGDTSGLIDRYYWYTVEGGYVTIIEEQPVDPYYMP